jgi:hypothetical protein
VPFSFPLKERKAEKESTFAFFASAEPDKMARAHLKPLATTFVLATRAATYFGSQ